MLRKALFITATAILLGGSAIATLAFARGGGGHGGGGHGGGHFGGGHFGGGHFAGGHFGGGGARVHVGGTHVHVGGTRVARGRDFRRDGDRFAGGWGGGYWGYGPYGCYPSSADYPYCYGLE
jgi:hypothetical protein